MDVAFKAGKNIAMKIPTHEYEKTVRFYRDILGLKEISSEDSGSTPRFDFGGKVLWLDCVSGISQSEVWLEIVSNDIDQAASYLEAQGCQRRDEIEPLPGDFKGFWVSSPSNIIHLVTSGNDA
jgi:catechol 2,3-dioxygenase-like lactoylglutathione lyase family enzyme